MYLLAVHPLLQKEVTQMSQRPGPWSQSWCTQRDLSPTHNHLGWDDQVTSSRKGGPRPCLLHPPLPYPCSEIIGRGGPGHSCLISSNRNTKQHA